MDESRSIKAEPTTVTYIWAGRTDPGVVRDHNEDAVLPQGSGRGAGTVAVADGLGGHPGGDVASRLAIEAIASAEDDDPTELIAGARQAVFERIVAESEERPELIAMATTLTLAILRSDAHVRVGHVGDSRLYFIHKGQFDQITEDHTIGMEKIRNGELTREEAEQDPAWHVILNFIGFERNSVETHDLEVGTGDTLLLCSDGLSNMIDHSDIEEILNEAASVEDRAERLLAAANDAGGADNISVVVVDVAAP